MSIYKGDKLIVGTVLNIDLTPDPIPTEGSPRHVMSGGVYTAILPKEDAANKTTVVDASSTDDQYPSAKAVYDALGDLEPANIGYARDLYAPDWSQAVAITQAALLLGYTAPKRGIFTGFTIPDDTATTGYIALNGIPIARTVRAPGIVESVSEAAVHLSVSPGDVIKSSTRMVINSTYVIYFVPYKAQ